MTPDREQPAGRTRQESAVAWLGTHAVELTGVGAPLVAGLVWSPWLDLVSAVLAAVWAANEIRLRRRTGPARRATVSTTPPPRQLSSTAAHSAPAPAAGTDRKEAKA